MSGTSHTKMPFEKYRPFLPLSAIQQALQDHLPASKQKLLAANGRVLARGHETAQAQLAAA